VGYMRPPRDTILERDEQCTREPSAVERSTARVIPEREMSESERARQLRRHAEQLAELRRYL